MTYLAVESIARGSMKSSRLILWIDEEALFQNAPATLRRLQRRGLEMRLCKGYGPHTKYYPYVESQDTFDAPLVTADDDMIYPSYWLCELANSNRQYRSVINCWLALRVTMNGDKISLFRSWGHSGSLEPSYLNQAQGVLGVIYPISFLYDLKAAGTHFEACCPRADDLWIHVTAIRAGIKIRQICKKLSYVRSRINIPNSGSGALYKENVLGPGNDLAILATYTRADIEAIKNDCAAEPAVESK